MNKIISIGVLAVLLAACAGKADRVENVTRTEFDNAGSVAEIQHMHDYRFRDTVRWNGRVYAYEIERKAVDSLGVVTDENGERYADNYIHLTVTRDGKPYFSHRFVKHDFSAYLDGGFRAHAILDGMAFECVQAAGVRFAVGVSYPLSDMSMPFVVTVDGSGNYSIEKDEVLDNIVETLDTLPLSDELR